MGRLDSLQLFSLFLNVDSTSLTFFEFSVFTSESFSSDDLSTDIWSSPALIFFPDTFCCWRLALDACMCLLSLALSASTEECKASNSTSLKWSGEN